MTISFSEQLILVLAIPVDTIALRKYVTGVERYMKIQNLGSAVGLTSTLDLGQWPNIAFEGPSHPQKIKDSEKSNEEMLIPVAASGITVANI